MYLRMYKHYIYIYYTNKDEISVCWLAQNAESIWSESMISKLSEMFQKVVSRMELEWKEENLNSIREVSSGYAICLLKKREEAEGGFSSL